MIYTLNISDNINGNSAQDYPTNGFYNPSYLGYAMTILGATCNFAIASTGTSPTIQIRTAASGGGDGITISLDSSNRKGNTTSDLSIPASTTLYLRWTNCNQLGDGQIDLDISPVTTVSLNGITDDDLDAMITIALGREVTPKEKNYIKRGVRRDIMRLINIPEMDFFYDLTTTANTDSYNLSTINANLKEITGVWLLDDNSEPSVEIVKVNDWNKFIKLRSDNIAVTNTQDQTNYAIHQQKIYFTPFVNANTFRIYGTKYLSDVTGSSADTLNTDYASSIELFVLSRARRLKNNATDKDISAAMELEKFAIGKLKMSADSEDGIEFSNSDTKRKG